MSIKLVVADLDGTLLSHSKDGSGALTWDQQSIDCINQLKAKNVYFSIATGRNYRDVLKIVDELKIDVLSPFFIAGANGSQLYNVSEQKLIYELFLDQDYLNRIYDFYDNFVSPIDQPGIAYIYCENNIVQVIKKNNAEFDGVWKRRQTFEKDSNLFEYRIVDQIDRSLKAYKFDLIFFDAISADGTVVKNLQAKAPDLNVMFTSIHSMEVNQNLADKGTSIRFLKDHFKFNSADILVLGDSDNDIPMFEEAKNIATRSCASETVKGYASQIFDGGPSSFVKHALKHYLDCQ